MEVKIESINEFIKKGMEIPSDGYVRISISKDDLKYDLIIQQARCRFLGNMYMTIDNALEIIFKGEGIVSCCRAVIIPSKMLKYYLESLDECVIPSNVFHINLLMMNQLKTGDTILFDTGRRGQIAPFDLRLNGQMSYRIIKKDGSLGVKNLILYGDHKYKCEDREFVDYDTISKLK